MSENSDFCLGVLHPWLSVLGGSEKNLSGLGAMLPTSMPEHSASTTASVEDSEIREEDKKFTVWSRLL